MRVAPSPASRAETSVARAILLFEAARQRRREGARPLTVGPPQEPERQSPLVGAATQQVKNRAPGLKRLIAARDTLTIESSE